MAEVGRTALRLWAFGRPHQRLVLASLGWMVLLGATTGAYAFLMGPALRFLLSGGDAGLGVLGDYFAFARGLDRGQALLVLPALVVGIGLLKGVAYLGQFYYAGLFGQRVVIDLRRALFEAIGRLSPVQRSGRLSGDLLTRMASDVSAVELGATYTVSAYLRDGVQLVILVAVALVLEWKVALIALGAIPLAIWPVSRLSRSLFRRTRDAQEELGAVGAQLQEGLGGLKTIQAYNGERAELRRFEGLAAQHQRSMERAAWAKHAVPGLTELLAAGGVAAALTYGVSGGALSADRLVSVLTAIVLMYQPAKELGRVSQLGLQAVAAGERILAVLELPVRVQSAPGAVALPPLQREVRLEGLRFDYGGPPVLDGVSLEVPAGKVVAVVGPSGSGKSTLVQLLLRFEQPVDGRILIDGQDAAGATVPSVRAQFALVTQEALLFSGSVLENLRVGRPSATQEEVEAAARVAQAHGFISALPRGYQTPVGERGVVLSGGQRQRLCLARAVLSQAPVLVLDEATSNLDPESEREVQQALKGVLAQRTALVVAHRLSTVANADRVYVLEKGRVVEEGAPSELLARGGWFAQMWRLQSHLPVPPEAPPGHLAVEPGSPG